ncbi:catenin delta-2-like isoform X2 [Corticium candelabrum]|uniref:catenin delta-2-like isoform X2 n=1 Tax=Corticium candelabrum TaxID=121492 RepID=UPI002E252CB3|nr:catenin delta-2-like isoform X2 [Corticium candelabrum]
MSETIQSKETEEANHDQDAGDDADKANTQGMARPGADYEWQGRNGRHDRHDYVGNDDMSEAESAGRLSGSALVDSCLKILYDRGFDADAQLEDSDDEFAEMGQDSWEQEMTRSGDLAGEGQDVNRPAGYVTTNKQPSRNASSHASNAIHPAGYGVMSSLPPDLMRPMEEMAPRQQPQQAYRDNRTGSRSPAHELDVERYHNGQRQQPQYREAVNGYPYDPYYDDYSDPDSPVKKRDPRYQQTYGRRDSESSGHDSIRKPSLSSYEDHSSEWSDQGTGKRTGKQYDATDMEDERFEHEPNLQEVIEYLNSDDYRRVAHAAGYLQHLSYKNDAMKARIRSLGAIPILIDLLRGSHLEVSHAAAGVLRNLCYGRANDDNKLAVCAEGGFPALVQLLIKAHSIEVKELVCSVLWNISSYEPLKEDLLNDALEVLSQTVIVPECGLQAGFQLTSNVVGELTNTVLLRNATGVLRNLSSASDQARIRMRDCGDLVDALLYTIMSAEGTADVDSKTVENCVCILRNLSYRLENEILPQLASEVVDEEWERAQAQERTQYEAEKKKKGKSSTGCFGSSKPRRKKTSASERGRIGTHLDQSGFGGSQLWLDSTSSRPKRTQAVYGQAMLWQPEVILPYLMLLKDSSNNVTLEAAAGALQNLSAGNWKWSAFIRNAIRKEKGLPILIELLQLPHDTVVRSVATALRNMAVDPRNKELIGLNGMKRLLSLLPGSNSTQLSNNTIAAVLCTIQEVITRNPENARLMKGMQGIQRIVSLAKSQQEYLPKVVQTANQICITLNNVKDLRVILKKEGWNVNDFQSSVMTDYDDGAAAAAVPNPDVAPAQSLKRHASTYSQYRERGSRGDKGQSPASGIDDQEGMNAEQSNGKLPNAHDHASRAQIQYKHRDSYEAPVASAREGFPEDMVGLYPPYSYSNRQRETEGQTERYRRHQDHGYQPDDRRRQDVTEEGEPMDDDTWV